MGHYPSLQKKTRRTGVSGGTSLGRFIFEQEFCWSVCPKSSLKVSPRRFPPPWSVEELDVCFVVKASNERPKARSTHLIASGYEGLSWRTVFICGIDRSCRVNKISAEIWRIHV
jgi:hypothetical protein